jgi:hypothetical protein
MKARSVGSSPVTASAVTGSEVTAHPVTAESCPECGSFDVRAVEPRWFAVDVERRSSWDSDWADRIEFGCRECGWVWD